MLKAYPLKLIRNLGELFAWLFLSRLFQSLWWLLDLTWSRWAPRKLYQLQLTSISTFLCFFAAIIISLLCHYLPYTTDCCRPLSSNSTDFSANSMLCYPNLEQQRPQQLTQLAYFRWIYPTITHSATPVLSSLLSRQVLQGSRHQSAAMLGLIDFRAPSGWRLTKQLMLIRLQMKIQGHFS